tara:strand:+ start:6288 stop:7355 length:1068 start_codon:yes stop_codon:yes gene_type:complete
MKTKFKKIQYVYYVCKKRAQQGQLSVARQFLEIAWLQATQGFGYALYHLAGMWDKESSWAYKNSFLSQKKYAKKISEINLRKYHGLTQYKPTEKAIFEFFGIPTGKYIGVLNPIWGKTKEGKTFCSSNDMQELLKSYIDVKICFKIFEGAGGKGFKAFHIRKENGAIMAYSLSHGEKYLLSDLYQMLLSENPAGWVVEEYITQHSALSEMNPSSVNTIRMFVYENNQGECVPLGSYLRIGAEGSLIDNLEGGGFGVEVDHRTGELIKDCIFCISDDHPLLFPDKDTATIKGNRIPFWKEAEEMGLKALRCYPNTRFLGLDISITEEGPVMIEMNILPSYLGLVWLRLKTKILLFQ